MTAQKMIISKHFINDREDRYLLIATKVGWGNPICETVSNQNPNCIQVLTDTGVLMIIEPKRNLLVTAYLPKYERVKAMYCDLGRQIPVSVARTIKRNQKLRNADK